MAPVVLWHQAHTWKGPTFGRVNPAWAKAQQCEESAISQHQLKHSAAWGVQCAAATGTGCCRVVCTPLCSAEALGPALSAVLLVPERAAPCCQLPQLKWAERTKKKSQARKWSGAGKGFPALILLRPPSPLGHGLGAPGFPHLQVSPIVLRWWGAGGGRCAVTPRWCADPQRL